MRVVVIGAFAPEYARNYTIFEGLRGCGVELDLRPFPKSLRAARRQRAVLASFPRRGEADAVFVPAFNQLIGPAAASLSRLRGVPVLIDYLVGLIDAADDRGQVGTAKSGLYRQIDRLNLRSLTALTDTTVHKAVLEGIAGCSLPRLHVLPVGARDLSLLPPPEANKPPLVQYTGTYIPFHGVEVILEAVRLLPETEFEMIGSGQTYKAMVARAEAMQLGNVRFTGGYFPQNELTTMHAHSTIMLVCLARRPKPITSCPTRFTRRWHWAAR